MASDGFSIHVGLFKADRYHTGKLLINVEVSSSAADRSGDHLYTPPIASCSEYPDAHLRTWDETGRVTVGSDLCCSSSAVDHRELTRIRGIDSETRGHGGGSGECEYEGGGDHEGGRDWICECVPSWEPE